MGAGPVDGVLELVRERLAERAAARSRARLPARAPDDDRHGRPGALLRAARALGAELQGVLAWAAAEGLDVAVVGLGSNLLVADEGYDGLALRLAGELAAIEVDGRACGLRRRRLAGGGRAPRHARRGSRASSSAAPSPARSAGRCA